MRTVKAVLFVFLAVLLVGAPARGQDNSVEVQAVLGNTVVLKIDGQRETLRVGETSNGITVVAANATGVTLDINGRTSVVGLSKSVSTNYQGPQEQVVTIARNASMQYQTNAMINGRSALVLVDTGANMVAMSAAQARSMSIDYSGGSPAQVQTASGISGAYGITLQSVSVGGIEVTNVPALVVHGDYPTTVLLGMSYLQHVKLQEHNGILSLSRNH